MTIRRTLAVAVVLGLAACGSTSPSPRDAEPATTPAPSAAVAAPVATGFFGNAQTVACVEDQRVLEAAIEGYLAMFGGNEVDEAQLVTEQFIREESVLYDIGPGGALIPAPTGGCPA